MARKEERTTFARKQTLSRRLSRIITIWACIIFFAFSIGANMNARRMVSIDAEHDAFVQLDYINLEVNSVLNNVVTLISNYEPLVSEELQKTHFDSSSIAYLTQHIVNSDSNIHSFVLSLDPKISSTQEGFSLLASRDSLGRTIITQTGKNKEYMQTNCYRHTSKTNTGVWSSPYESYYTPGVWICSYSQPLHNKSGEFIGMITANISTSRLTQFLGHVNIRPNALTLIISDDGELLLSDSCHSTLKDSFIARHEDSSDTLWQSIEQKMHAGEHGECTLMNSDETVLYYYSPLSQLQGWSIGVACNKSEILMGLNKQTRTVVIFDILVAICMFLLISRLIKRHTKPIRELANSAREIAQGNYNASLPEPSPNSELMELQDAFDYMQHSLDFYNRQLKKQASEKQRLASEKELSRVIQEGMIPHPTQAIIDCPYTDIYGIIRPAREVGGDLYDYFITPTSMFIAIGDVSGKGIPASLLMTEVKTMLHTLKNAQLGPARMINIINHFIIESNRADMFVTMFLGTIEFSTGKFTYCNAGHNPPILCSPDGTTVELPVESNMPLGCFDDIDFVEQEVFLTPGQLVMLYTDGISEAENAFHERYGVPRLLQFISDSRALAVQHIAEGLLNHIIHFMSGSDQSDDISMLGLRYHHPELAPKPFATTLYMSNNLNELEKITAILDELQTHCPLTDELKSSINLALEEIVVNIINYAYTDTKHHQIAIYLSLFQNKLEFAVSDDGKAFDPTKAPDADIDAPIEDRSIGGLGIFIARQTMDEMEYIRVDETNILLMRKTI